MEDQESYNPNPYATRSTNLNSSMNEDGSMSVSISAHRENNSGFGSKNLEALASPY
jgi:hypothetical protein